MLTGRSLETGLNAILGLPLIHDFDPASTTVEGGRTRMQPKTILPALALEHDILEDERGAVDAICHFPQGLPPVRIQYTLQRKNFAKLERFTRLARRRGGQHIYIMVSPGKLTDPDVPEYYLFVAGRIIRDYLYALAQDPDNNAVWVLALDSKYIPVLNRNASEVVSRLRARFEKRLTSRTRKFGKIFRIRGDGTGIIETGMSSFGFRFDNVPDEPLRQALSGAVRRRKLELFRKFPVSFETQREAGSDRVLAVSIIAADKDSLDEIKRRLYFEHIAHDFGPSVRITDL